MQIITLSEQKWAVGLWWQPLVSAPRKQVNELSSQSPEAEANPYNVFALLKARKQIGVGRSQSVKDDAGAPSLAAALTRVFDQHGNVLACFRFDDGNSWLFAVKDGQILPGGDLYGEDEEVLDQFRRYAQTNVWRQVVETANTQESEQKIRECLEALTRAMPKLRPVSRSFWVKGCASLMRAHPKATISTAIAVILLIVAVIGTQQYLNYRNEKNRAQKLEAQRALLQQRLAQERKSLSEVQKELFPEKWRQEPDALSVVRDCYMKLRNEPYQVKGWMLSEIACGPKEARIVRKRSNWASFTVLPEGAQFQIKDPNQAIITANYEPQARQSRMIIEKEFASANIYELAGILGSAVELTWEQPEPRDVPEEELKKNRSLPKIVLSPYWIGTFHLKEVPRSFVTKPFGLDKIPGLAVRKVHKKDNTWSIEGVVYAK